MYKNFFPANELLSRHFNTIKYEVLSSTFEGVSCRTSKTFPPKVSDKRCEEGLSLDWKKTIAKRVSMESSIWLFIRYAFLTFFRADFDRAPFRARSELGSLRELYFEGTDVRA